MLVSIRIRFWTGEDGIPVDELLEVLASKSNCFISDLKAEHNRSSLLNVLGSISPNEYSSAAWTDAFLT